MFYRSFDLKTLIIEPLNETAVYDSFEAGSEYVKYFCPGEYLQKSSQIARYEVKFTVKTQLIAAMYQSGLLKKNMLAYMTSAFLSGSNGE